VNSLLPACVDIPLISFLSARIFLFSRKVILFTSDANPVLETPGDSISMSVSSAKIDKIIFDCMLFAISIQYSLEYYTIYDAEVKKIRGKMTNKNQEMLTCVRIEEKYIRIPKLKRRFRKFGGIVT